MSRRDDQELLADPSGLPLDQVDQLVADHGRLSFALTTVHRFADGQARTVHVNGDPALAVTQVLRLAHLGAMAEAAWREDPNRKVFTVIGDAQRRWVRIHGGA